MSMFDIVVDPNYFGPSIIELESSIPDIQADTVDVKWTNTKPEFYIIQKYRGKKNFRLHVADIQAQERASSYLGRTLQVDKNVIENGKTKLNTQGWREFANELGPSVTRSVMTKIAADAIREGRPVKFASVAQDCLLDSVNPLDADVLFRLRILSK